MEQSFKDWDLDYVARRNDYWRKLRLARADYELNACHGHYEPDTRYFITWMLDKWGIEVSMSKEVDGISGDYTVVDPKKYMLFQIKYV